MPWMLDVGRRGRKGPAGDHCRIVTILCSHADSPPGALCQVTNGYAGAVTGAAPSTWRTAWAIFASSGSTYASMGSLYGTVASSAVT